MTKTGRRVAVAVTVVVSVAFWGAGVASAGTGWVIQPTPNAPGAQSSELAAVSCPAPKVCFAAGDDTLRPGVDRTLVEAWNGIRWAIQPTPGPAGARSSFLNGVSCPRTAACIAVGAYDNRSGVLVTLAERWDGVRWMVQPTPNPAGAGASVLQAVSCARFGACTAVGQFSNRSGVFVTLAERWDGVRWVIQPTPNPAGAGGGLSGVSCSQLDLCIAVGGGAGGTLAERWNGVRWSIQPSANPPGGTNSFLKAVSCRTPASCTAAGTYFRRSGAEVTLAEELVRGQWSVQPTPNLSGASVSFLLGVSCGTPVTCTAVGVSENPARGRSTTLAEYRQHGRWVIQPTPNPPVGNPFLSGISCPLPVSCTAVGSTIQPGNAGLLTTLAEHR